MNIISVYLKDCTTSMEFFDGIALIRLSNPGHLVDIYVHDDAQASRISDAFRMLSASARLNRARNGTADSVPEPPELEGSEPEAQGRGLAVITLHLAPRSKIVWHYDSDKAYVEIVETDSKCVIYVDADQTTMLSDVFLRAAVALRCGCCVEDEKELSVKNS